MSKIPEFLLTHQTGEVFELHIDEHGRKAWVFYARLISNNYKGRLMRLKQLLAEDDIEEFILNDKLITVGNIDAQVYYAGL